jgi:hypothetical protein
VRLRRAVTKAALAIGGALALATAVIGVAHTPFGRPLLRLPLLSALAQHAGCPVGPIEPAAFEQVRTIKLRSELGTSEAASHPALGFELGHTRRSDIEHWAANTRASCHEGTVASVLECSDVTSFGTPTISRLTLQFDTKSRLVSVDLLRATPNAAEAVAHLSTLDRDLTERVGPATSLIGQAEIDFITSTPLQTVARSYRYRDYTAQAMLLNLGKRGFRLREQYSWLERAEPA